MISVEEQQFVWDCCDELEQARERETVLRVVEKLRKRFEVDAALQNVSEAEKKAWRERFRNDPAARVPCGIENAAALPAPESGVEFPPLPLEGRDGPRAQLVTTDGDWPAPEERLDMNDSDDWEREP